MAFRVNLLHYYLVIFQSLSFWIFFSTFDHIKDITTIMIEDNGISAVITAEISAIRFYYLPYLP